jgi:hypothetical protein
MSDTFQQPAQVPMTMGQILDRIARIMRTHFRLLMGIAAVPSVALFLLMAAWVGFIFLTLGPQLGMKSGTPPALPFPPFLLAALACPIEVILILICAIYLPAACFAAVQADTGAAVSFRDAYVAGWRSFGRAFWMMILMGIFVLAPLFVVGGLFAACVALGVHMAGAGVSPTAGLFLIPLIVLFYLAFLVYSILIAIRFSVAMPACVVENIGAWRAMQRSAVLTRGAKGRIFLVFLIVYAVSYIANFLCIAVFYAVGAVGALAAMAAHVDVHSPALFILIGLAAIAYLGVMVVCASFSYATITVAQTVLYHDQRLRFDGAAAATLPQGDPA